MKVPEVIVKKRNEPSDEEKENIDINIKKKFENIFTVILILIIVFSIVVCVYELIVSTNNYHESLEILNRVNRMVGE